MTVPFKARIAAQDLRASIHELKPEAIGENLSKLSVALGGGDISMMPWSASLQVAYILALVVESVSAAEMSKVLNLHGVPIPNPPEGPSA